jgi:hypothetical protein
MYPSARSDVVGGLTRLPNDRIHVRKDAAYYQFHVPKEPFFFFWFQLAYSWLRSAPNLMRLRPLESGSNYISWLSDRVLWLALKDGLW